jgi:dTDP-4-dehydrorhamnose reductase
VPGQVLAARVIGVSRNRPESARGGEWRRLDIRDAAAVDRLIGAVGPDLVVHCAAVVGDWAATATGSVHVALAAAGHGVRQVHLSIDAVFASREAAYCETDLPCPVTPYGAAKAAAETALSAIDATAAIVRTSLIIGSNGSTGRERLVHEAVADPSRMAFFTDEIRSPVALDDLVAAVWEIAKSDRSGVHHVAGLHSLSRYELAVLIARRDDLDAERLRPALRGDSPGAAVIRLDCTATQATLRTTRLRGAREFLSP